MAGGGIKDYFCRFLSLCQRWEVKQKPRTHLFCKASVLSTDVPAVARLHRANKFASAAAHLPPALAASLYRKEKTLENLRYYES